MDFTERTRLSPHIPESLMKQLQCRMMELGLYKDHHMHLGDLTWLFAYRGWVLVTKKDTAKSCVYPPDSSVNHMLSGLREW